MINNFTIICNNYLLKLTRLAYENCFMFYTIVYFEYIG